MKPWLLGLLTAALLIVQTPDVAEAKRLGGGKAAGMQRSTPTQPAAPATPTAPAPANAAVPGKPAAPQQAAPAAAATGAAAAAGKRSWMGPLAGLAAGLGIAALLSHFGLGEAFADMMMVALIALVAVVAIGWLLRRFGASRGAKGPQLAGATAGAAGSTGSTGSPLGAYGADPSAPSAPVGATVTARTGGTPEAGFRSAADSFSHGTPVEATQLAPAAAARLPVDFDQAGFERLARMIFIRMQAANDAGDLDDLRGFTTPELFAHIRLDLQERGQSTQHTDVLEVQASVLDFVREDGRDIVSVRYQGLIREEAAAPAAPFDEVWHLVQPSDRSRNWAIAGIQPVA